MARANSRGGAGRGPRSQAGTGCRGRYGGPEPALDAGALRWDPLGHLARAAGFSDGERWWDYLIESRAGEDAGVFDAVREAMTTLRGELRPEEQGGGDDALRERHREAYMRRCIRAAVKEGYERIAVVCGAWHVPALETMPAAREDNALLKGLKKVKTGVAWTAWTYERLALMSGYGAGVASPEWYHLLWETRGAEARGQGPVPTWLTRVARLMREQDLDASSAHVIEAVRLAETLAAMRGRSQPGLDELDEAALTVICTGEPAPMQLIRQRLVVGCRIGSVPEYAPMPPLQRDLERLQKRLRLSPASEIKELDLDLRKPNDLERSWLLHRLNLLAVPWGRRQVHRDRGRGTFREVWRLQWEPEWNVRLIEASRWGATVAEAAAARTIDAAGTAESLGPLTEILDDALLANLPEAVQRLVTQIESRSATSADVTQLMAAIPPLASIRRYGNVRRTDGELVRHVLDGMITRTCVGLVAACSSLNEEAAAEMYERISAVHEAVTLIGDDEHSNAWQAVLGQVTSLTDTNGLIVGRSLRLLYDDHAIGAEAAAKEMHLRLSPAVEAPVAAAWLEGFLRGSGLILIHDDGLWRILDQWLSSLAPDRFIEVLPLLRRTFATFQAPERRQMGERVSRDGSTVGSPAAASSATTSARFDYGRANRVLPTLSLILGKPFEPDS